MKAKFFALAVLISLLTACTSLNDNCEKMAQGDCWPDVNKCGIVPHKKYLELCKNSNWHCGYEVNFGDP